MATGNRELMHECSTKHSRMGTAIMKYDKETDEEGKKRGVSMERRKAGTKKRSPDGLSQHNQNKIIKHNIAIFNKKWKTNNEIQLTKKKMNLNIRKMRNNPPSPGTEPVAGVCIRILDSF